ncbi:UDP-N-acetylmuramoyl-tripeptide--D-alanyl-D-alanine ligase [Alkalicoccobacillus gibsonii]|uniref:UDP-N-acetylmuramoyl-tripeptide--D-alanyl-D- alanine ligase n=1 Tax=Alkalicoccobacillus gibsonii TaxID=79881 RepID=UPI001933B0E3|nr:UDP-N-acetylmuramoyl-tripeptide--D-alanyl-D-alanine ligase [Alkalicoccobacillus gibsonii]MBM0065258.1 UDP-N-acetylmuramoyl-tripeptide--D-alanyl-D-alanine ligase [Alkalicoccobacillus gibsonii]
MSIAHHLIKSVSTHLRLTEDVNALFSSVSIDTRSLQEGALYVPISGERFDGHQFIEKAIEEGAQASIWQKDMPVPASLPAEFQLYFVEDTLLALQKLAKLYRKEVNPKVIGVTGSNGKTTVKDMLASILSYAGTTYKTQGNYNNHIGLPLTILGMPADCQFLILEMGMSGFGEIHLLSTLSEPDAAIITNIGESHMEQLGSREGIAKAKAEIRDGLVAGGMLYIDGDEPLLQMLKGKDVCTVGFDRHNHNQVTNVLVDSTGFQFKLQSVGDLTLPMLGKHNVKNAALAASLAKGLGVSFSHIQAGLKQVKVSGMRLERLVGDHGELIINDAYNASPTSMKASVDALKDLDGFTHYIAVLGDMYELGANEKAFHEQIADDIETPITHLITVGDKGKWLYEATKRQQKSNGITLNHAPTLEEAANLIKPLLNDQTVILLKASRGLKLETILNYLKESGKGEMNK